MPDDPQQPPREASTGEVRVLGGFFLIGGLILIFIIPSDMSIHGAIPAWWAGIGVLALGVSMLLFPSVSFFRRRVARFPGIGEQFTAKKDKEVQGP
jgi:hypothetical protein